MDLGPEAIDLTRVYTRTGRVAHLLGQLSSPNSFDNALCGAEPRWPDFWFGTGTQAEYDQAEGMPTCRKCTLAVRKGQR